jgi:hypothetical protein
MNGNDQPMPTGSKKRFECVFCKHELTLISERNRYTCSNVECVCAIPPQLEYEADTIENLKSQEELNAWWAEERIKLNDLRKIYGL